jgi:hypothetical protein
MQKPNPLGLHPAYQLTKVFVYITLFDYNKIKLLDNKKGWVATDIISQMQISHL